MRHLIPCFLLLLLTACSGGREAASPQPREGARAGKAEASRLSYERERRYNELFLEAVRQKQLDRFDAEHELLKEALRVKPGAPEALYELALLKLAFFSFADSAARAEGIGLLKQAVEAAPENVYYKELYANFLASTGNYKAAIELVEALVEAKPESERLALLVQLYEADGDLPGAIRSLDRLERLEGRSEPISLEKFHVYDRMNDAENAYRAIEELCAEYPYDLRYRVLLGDLYDREGHHEMALDIYRDVLAAEPDNSYAQLSLLAYYKKAGADSLYLDLLNTVVLNPRTQTEARIEALRAYATDNLNAKADPAPVMALFRRALAAPQENRATAELAAHYMAALKMPEDSLRPVCRLMLEVEPDYSPARLQLLQYALLRGNIEEAEEICKEGELYDPSNLTFVYYRGVTLYRLGRNAAAVEVLRKGALRTAKDIDSESDDVEMRSDLYALMGDILHDEGQIYEAFNAYDKALEFNPTNYLCMNNYAYFLSLRGERLEEAEKMSRLTVEADRENETYLDTYAWVLFKLGRYEQARIYIDETVRHAEEVAGNASLFDHAGDIYLKLGKRREAARHWRTALRLSNDAKLTRILKKKLRIR